jgi:hypothetical protein
MGAFDGSVPLGVIGGLLVGSGVALLAWVNGLEPHEAPVIFGFLIVGPPIAALVVSVIVRENKDNPDVPPLLVFAALLLLPTEIPAVLVLANWPVPPTPTLAALILLTVPFVAAGCAYATYRVVFGLVASTERRLQTSRPPLRDYLRRTVDNSIYPVEFVPVSLVVLAFVGAAIAWPVLALSALGG